MTWSFDKMIKGVAGAIVLVVLLVMVLRWWGDYRLAAVEASLPETSATAAPVTTPQGEGESTTKPDNAESNTKAADASNEEKAAGEKQTVVVLIEGLNFREKADRGSKAIRALSKGEKVELVQTVDSWYQVKDTNGDTGWISSNPAYAKVEK